MLSDISLAFFLKDYLAERILKYLTDRFEKCQGHYTVYKYCFEFRTGQTYKSEHLIELAKPRPVDSSQRNRSYSDIGTVTKAALNSKCNERISQLATGKTRKSTELIEFDPDAYKVSHRL